MNENAFRRSSKYKRHGKGMAWHQQAMFETDCNNNNGPENAPQGNNRSGQVRIALLSLGKKQAKKIV